jgi:hypothetical protein
MPRETVNALGHDNMRAIQEGRPMSSGPGSQSINVMLHDKRARLRDELRTREGPQPSSRSWVRKCTLYEHEHGPATDADPQSM